MTDFIKVSEAPKTKLQLKKAILSGSILVYVANFNHSPDFTKLDSVDSIIKIWNGFKYAPKYLGETNHAYACVGTSFYYKFKFN